MTDGFPDECFLPVNPIPCTDPAPDPPHYFFSATRGPHDYGYQQLEAGQCNENKNSFPTEAMCRSRCQGLKHFFKEILENISLFRGTTDTPVLDFW